MFCGGKLLAYNVVYPSDFQRYVLYLLDWKGKGYQVMGATPGTFFGNNGRVYTTLEGKLGRAGEGYSVNVTLFSNETYGVSNYQVQYRDLGFEAACF